MKKLSEPYGAPEIEIILFPAEAAVTTSITFDAFDDGGFFVDKW